MGQTTVFWDWNGTLCDDRKTALDAVNVMLRRRGEEALSVERYLAAIDTPIERFYAHFFDLEKEPVEVLLVEYHRLYRELLPENCIAAGATEVLEAFRGKGFLQVLLSSSHKESILPPMIRGGLLPYFSAVLAADDWLAKSKTERAKRYIQSNGIDGKDCWFIGDLLHDRDTAESCGGNCLLLPFGHQPEADLRAAGECFCPSFEEAKKRILGEGNI